MRNIDVIYSLLEICRRADSLNARIGAIGKLEQLDIGDLCQLKNGTYFDQMRTQVFAAAGLLRLLTADYKRRLEEVDFSAGEFLMDTERVALASSVLCEEWEHFMELFWSLEAFCECEITNYLQMTQECYRHDFEPIKIVIREAEGCLNGFSQTPNCMLTKQ